MSIGRPKSELVLNEAATKISFEPAIGIVDEKFGIHSIVRFEVESREAAPGAVGQDFEGHRLPPKVGRAKGISGLDSVRCGNTGLIGAEMDQIDSMGAMSCTNGVARACVLAVLVFDRLGGQDELRGGVYAGERPIRLQRKRVHSGVVIDHSNVAARRVDYRRAQVILDRAGDLIRETPWIDRKRD